MRLAVDPGKPWWEQRAAGAPEGAAAKRTKHDGDSAALYRQAEGAYTEECERYNSAREDMTPADRKWFADVVAHGTASDRQSALAVAAKDAPFYGLEWLARLASLAAEPGRAGSYAALEALADSIAAALPPGRELARFASSGLSASSSRRALVLAYYEDSLLSIYEKAVSLLRVGLHDKLPHGRETAMRILLVLLTAKHPSGPVIAMRGELLSLLANKLGDPSRKIASRAAFYLCSVVDADPEASSLVAKLASAEAVRLGAANDKPAYYGLTVLSQLRLRRTDPATTDAALSAYTVHLERFLSSLDGAGKKGGRKTHEEEDIPRTVRVALTGLARAVPFVSPPDALDAYVARILAVAGRMRTYATLLQAAALVLGVFLSRPETLSTLGQMVREHVLDVSRLADATASHAMLMKLVLRTARQLVAVDTPAATEELRLMLKALLATTPIVSAPAYSLAALLILDEALALRPALRLLLTFPESADDAGSALWEVALLARHVDASVSSAALCILRGERVSAEVDPFEAMTPAALLQSVISQSS